MNKCFKLQMNSLNHFRSPIIFLLTFIFINSIIYFVMGSTKYLSRNYICFTICLDFLRCLHVFESPFPCCSFITFTTFFLEIFILLNVYYCCYFSLIKGNYIYWLFFSSGKINNNYLLTIWIFLSFSLFH